MREREFLAVQKPGVAVSQNGLADVETHKLVDRRARAQGIGSEPGGNAEVGFDAQMAANNFFGHAISLVRGVERVRVRGDKRPAALE